MDPIGANQKARNSSNKKRKRKKKKQTVTSEPKRVKRPEVGRNSGADSSAAPGKKLSKLQLKFQRKLQGAQFRRINEELYTSDSAAAFAAMKKNTKEI